MKPSELIAKPENWVKRVLSRSNENGEICYCISGAIYASQSSNFALAKIYDMIHTKLLEKYGNQYSSIIQFNDAYETNHEDVINLLKSCDL